jgi:hypothetical protein
MVRRSAVSAAAVVVAFLLGLVLANRPVAVNAQTPAGHGKCIAVSPIPSRTDPNSYRVYRAFEDGTVESADDMPGTPAEWRKLGK